MLHLARRPEGHFLVFVFWVFSSGAGDRGADDEGADGYAARTKSADLSDHRNRLYFYCQLSFKEEETEDPDSLSINREWAASQGSSPAPGTPGPGPSSGIRLSKAVLGVPESTWLGPGCLQRGTSRRGCLPACGFPGAPHRVKRPPYSDWSPVCCLAMWMVRVPSALIYLFSAIPGPGPVAGLQPPRALCLPQNLQTGHVLCFPLAKNRNVCVSQRNHLQTAVWGPGMPSSRDAHRGSGGRVCRPRRCF